MKHPECTQAPDECVIQEMGTYGTAMAWAPTYDGNGNPRGQPLDPNTYTTDFRCMTCGRSWQRKRRGDKEWIA